MAKLSAGSALHARNHGDSAACLRDRPGPATVACAAASPAYESTRAARLQREAPQDKRPSAAAELQKNPRRAQDRIPVRNPVPKASATSLHGLLKLLTEVQ